MKWRLDLTIQDTLLKQVILLSLKTTRAILNLPLGNTESKVAGIMVNLVGLKVLLEM
jgi:hypothetical protein